MKIEFDREDIEQVAQRVAEYLKPLLANKGNQNLEDVIFTPETLSNYLSVDLSWVYRQVSDKKIPYFKNGKFLRFRKTSIDNWISSHERQPIPKFKQVRNSRVNS